MSHSRFDDVVAALLDNIGDKDSSDVCDTTLSTLGTIGQYKSELLLQLCLAYLARNSKLSSLHRGTILRLVSNVCSEHLTEINNDLVALMINLAVQEMCMSKEFNEVWQQPASELLVAVGRLECTEVIDALLQKFSPGVLPHSYTILTLGELAVSNPFGFVPFLTDILCRIDSVITSIKSDHLKYAVSTAVTKFCEGVREYVSNIDKAPDPTVKKEIYSSQIGTIYDYIFANWLTVKDYKVRGAVIECLGECCHIITSEKLQEELRRLHQTLLLQYKKHGTIPAFTRGIYRMLNAAIDDDNCPIESYLEDIWISLFPHAYCEIDYNNPATSENQKEVLRCFNVTAVRFGDKLVYYLLQKLHGNIEKSKITALRILRHLVNSAGPHMEDKKSLIILGLKPILNDANNKVRMQICQFAVALADHDYLISSETGRLVVDYLLKLLCLSWDDSTLPQQGKKSTDGDHVLLNSAVRAQSSNALQVLTNSMQQAENVLWPYLFEFICIEQYTAALPEICKSLATLSQRMRQANRLNDEFTRPHGKNERLPGPHQLFARLLIIASVANAPLNRAEHAINLISQLQPIFNIELEDSWNKILVPRLLKTLQEHDASSNSQEEEKIFQKDWETLLLKFLSKSIDAVKNDAWLSSLADAMGQQFHLYNSFPLEKRFLFRCLGGVLMKISDRQFIIDRLDLMFRAVNHSVFLEREGCAMGVGYCASVHVDLVLTKLENEAKQEYQRRNKGMLGFINSTINRGDTDGPDIANLKATIALCFGYATLYCPVTLITNRLDTIIMHFLMPYFEQPRSVVVKQSLLKTADLIGTSIHHDHLNADYTFTQRPKLIASIQDYLKSENPDVMNTNVRILAMDAASTLSKLDPALGEQDIWAFCAMAASAVYQLQSSKDEENVNQEDLGGVNSAVSSLHSLFENILCKSPIGSTLSVLLRVTWPWMADDKEYSRQRALQTVIRLLKTYNKHADVTVGHATELSVFGGSLARLAVRCADCNVSVRHFAQESVHLLCTCSVLHYGHGKDYTDQQIDAVLEKRDYLERKDLQSHLIVISHIAGIVTPRLSSKQLQFYLSCLFELLLDKQSGISNAAATLLCDALILRGRNLVEEAELIVATTLKQLAVLFQHQPSQAYTTTLLALHSFATHHLNVVLKLLLQEPLPLSNFVCDCWHALAHDPNLLLAIINKLLEPISSPHNYLLQTLDGSKQIYAKINVLSTLAALVEVLKCGEPEDIILQNFPILLARFIVCCGALAGSVFPRTQQLSPDYARVSKPAHFVQNALKVLLQRVKAEHILSAFNEQSKWLQLLDLHHFADCISELCRSLTLNYPQWIEGVNDQLEQWIAPGVLPRVSDTDPSLSIVDGQRTAAYAALAEFIRQPNQEEELSERLLTSYMGGLADFAMAVRKLSVRGLGNVSFCSDQVVERYCPTVLAAVMSGLEDPHDVNDEIVLESMTAMSKFVTRIEYRHVDKVLLNILIRIRSCFEKESGAVRTVAFRLFGLLARFGPSELLVEQIHTNLVSLLVHLNDVLEDVQKACLFTMNEMAPRMSCDEFCGVLEKHYGLNGRIVQYREFLQKIAKVLAIHYPDSINLYALCCTKYYTGDNTRLKCNAVLLTGFLLGAASDTLKDSLPVDQIFTGLSVLLKEPDSEVKLCATDACAYLHSYVF